MVEPNVLENQPCPVCKKKTLALMETEKEIPYFGNVYIFSMSCSECKYHKADVESKDEKEPCKYTIDINDSEDMKIRVVKSSEATIKIPHVVTIESGPASNGYITNVEGVLNRVKKQIEVARDSADEDDEDSRRKAKNLLKKLFRVKCGQESLKMIIEDPSGNSAIVSDKAVKSKS